MDFEILREVLVKNEESTNPEFGREPDKREIEEYLQTGFVILDKVSGPTSHQVSAWVKDILHLKKVGHSGTLDPQVTGVLPVALDDGTKILQALFGCGKEYVFVLHLHGDVNDKEIKKSFEYFTGKIYQRPPIKSAVKRELRIREIYGLELLERAGRDVLARCHCESGTYIRKLCHDLGLFLGVGGHMADLRRTKVGWMDETRCVTLHDLKDAYENWKETGNEKELRKLIMPMELAIQDLKKIWVIDSAVDAICHGANLNVPGVVKLETGIKKGELVSIFTLKNELVAFGKILMESGEILASKKGEVVDLDRVVMKPDTYPKGWKTKEKEG